MGNNSTLNSGENGAVSSDEVGTVSSGGVVAIRRRKGGALGVSLGAVPAVGVGRAEEKLMFQLPSPE